METSSTFYLKSQPPLSPGDVRLTRLNIYSGLYIEYHQVRLLVDPSKVVPQAALELEPDVILVSHESMDHFDAVHCLKLLSRPGTYLIGSWGVMMALADCLAPDDPVWDRIYVGVPGVSFRFGDLVIGIEEALHCEYASPIFFDIQDSATGFRIVHAVDSDITTRMRTGGIPERPDVLVVPLGIALTASASQAWKMVNLLQPRMILASHYTTQDGEFAALAAGSYGKGNCFLPKWHEGVTIEGSNPAAVGRPMIAVEDPELFATLSAPTLADWLTRRPSKETLLGHLWSATDVRSMSVVLDFIAWNALLGQSGDDVLRALDQVANRCFSATSDPSLAAAFLLAYGATVGALNVDDAAGISRLHSLLAPDRPYLDYWILESWGRAAGNLRVRAQIVTEFEEVVGNKELFSVVGVRRKMMWEVHRLVASGYVWPDLVTLLTEAQSDVNPDVRLLAFKILTLSNSICGKPLKLLSHGLNDPHEDVLEWVLIAYLRLFSSVGPEERALLRAQLPRLLTHRNYHVREKANMLTELLGCLEVH